MLVILKSHGNTARTGNVFAVDYMYGSGYCSYLTLLLYLYISLKLYCDFEPNTAGCEHKLVTASKVVHSELDVD